MCLAIPGRIVEINHPVAIVDFGGIKKRVDISLVDPDVGDYVVVHAGFAIQILDAKEAEETLNLWQEMLAFEKR